MISDVAIPVNVHPIDGRTFFHAKQFDIVNEPKSDMDY